MDAQVVQEFNGETGKWDTLPPDPPAAETTPEVKPAVVEPPDADDAPPVAAKTTTEKPAEKKPRNDPQARIDQAIARQKEAERKAEAAEARARELEARTTPEPKPAAKPELVKSDKFLSFQKWVETHPEANESDDPLRDYNEAFYDHKRGIERQQEAEQRETAAIETSFRSEVDAFSAKFAEAVQADPEVEKRINQRLLQVRPVNRMTKADKDYIRSLQTTNPPEADRLAFESFLASQWLASDHPVQLLEHLSDPKEFQRLATLPPDRVIRELAKVEAGFSAAPAEPAPKPSPITSKAKPPITPVGSSPHVPDDSPSDDDSDDEWARKENARVLRQRRALRG